MSVKLLIIYGLLNFFITNGKEIGFGGFDSVKMNRTQIWVDVAKLLLKTPSPQTGIVVLIENIIGDKYVEPITQELGPVTLLNFAQMYTISWIKVKLLIIVLENVENVYNKVVESKIVLNNIDHLIILKSKADSYEDNFIEIWRTMFPRGIKVLRLYDGNILVRFPYPIHYCTEIECDSFIVHGSNLNHFNDILSRKVINMNQRDLKISIFERKPSAILLPNGTFTGFDSEVLNILRQKMNFTVHLIEATNPNCRYLYKLEDGTYCGAISDLIYDFADVCFNNMFLKNYGVKNITFSVSVGHDMLCVVVPPARPVPQWLVLFSTFNLDEWFCIIAMYFICTSVVYCMERIVNRTLYSYFDSMFYSFAYIVQSPVSRLPTRNSLRIAVITATLCGFVITIYFQASLLTMLTKDIYEKEINTLEELDASDLKIYSSSANLKDTFSQESPISQSLSKKFVVNENAVTNYVGMVASGNRMAAIGRKYDLGGKFGIDLRSNIHLVTDCPRVYLLVYPLPYLSPYIESMNSILGRLFDSGVLQSYFVSYSFTPLSNLKKLPGSTNYYAPLNLTNLKILFLILILGCSGALIVFVIENILAFKQNQFTKPKNVNKF